MTVARACLAGEIGFARFTMRSVGVFLTANVGLIKDRVVRSTAVDTGLTAGLCAGAIVSGLRRIGQALIIDIAFPADPVLSAIVTTVFPIRASAMIKEFIAVDRWAYPFVSTCQAGWADCIETAELTGFTGKTSLPGWIIVRNQ